MRDFGTISQIAPVRDQKTPWKKSRKDTRARRGGGPPQQGSGNQPEQSSRELTKLEQHAQCLHGFAPGSLLWIPV